MTGTPEASPAPTTPPQQDGAVDVVVVGAGVAGLVVARDLAARGRRVLLLERDARPGGCVASVQVAGLTVDAGAESFATRSSVVPDLLAELG
ncbi:FAD-dependent oxidoreductase, partial [Actinotalea ferrariae]|uniref:FAD-dependent oxidoreductase n=1 Tax=Actinotalea ferrariae TaxID=1386098 RepID=UPI00055643FD